MDKQRVLSFLTNIYVLYIWVINLFHFVFTSLKKYTLFYFIIFLRIYLFVCFFFFFWCSNILISRRCVIIESDAELRRLISITGRKRRENPTDDSHASDAVIRCELISTFRGVRLEKRRASTTGSAWEFFLPSDSYFRPSGFSFIRVEGDAFSFDYALA